jgi:hypothetical protein
MAFETSNNNLLGRHWAVNFNIAHIMKLTVNFMKFESMKLTPTLENFPRVAEGTFLFIFGLCITPHATPAMGMAETRQANVPVILVSYAMYMENIQNK